MAEEAKNIRRSARSRFTRKRNELLKSISDRRDLEVVENNYTQLGEAWNILEGKHDIYTMYLTDEEMETAENWITELQDFFAEATALKLKYVNDIIAAESIARAEANREESKRKEHKQVQRMIEQAFIKRETAQVVFETLYKSTIHVMEADKIAISLVKKLQIQLEEAFMECKQAQGSLLEFMNRESAETEIKWISNIQTRYNELTEKLETHIDGVESKNFNELCDTKFKRNDGTIKPSNLHLEKIKMPRFEGELREYPQFKRDFEKQVMPNLNRNTAPYTLRSCLGKEPLAQVKSVDDDIDEMWKRLDEKYGDPAKVADAIVNDIRKVRAIKEGENKKFIEFVDIVEDGYRDLKILGLETEITTTSSVSIIERKLPSDIRKEWAKLVSSEACIVDKTNKFPSLLKFLLTQKRAIEYDTAELRTGATSSAKVTIHHTVANEYSDNRKPKTYSKCVFHDNVEHSTSECKLYLSKPVEERIKLLKDKGACWSCLKGGHRLRECRKRKDCGIKDCKKKHHPTLHDENPEANIPVTSSACNSPIKDKCLLQLQKIRTKTGWINVMWDTASSLSFITNSKAKAEKLQGTAVELSIVRVGAEKEAIKSKRYKLPLIDLQGNLIIFEVYGIERITSDIQSVDIDSILHIFNVPKDEIVRPTGNVDVLIGYEYAGFHPEKEQSSGHLMLLKNRFGLCIGGTHPSIKETNEQLKFDDVQIHHVKGVKIDDFYNIENLGIDCTPRCGGCKCGKCPPGSKDYTLKEEKELKLIENNLQFDNHENTWITEYPWIKDPSGLPDNRRAAIGRLVSTEKRLERNPKHAEVYQQQIKDMIDRGVARKLAKEELNAYNGPVHYISHHAVLKPDSKSTPVRIVFNSSANYMGHVLNDYWAKGPDLLNSLLGILIRFRENEVGFIGDVKKMYHTVKTKITEQHTHRFLWRDMDIKREPDTYVIQRVSFGDKPSGTIATVAMRKTAEIGEDYYPHAAKVIKDNTYMDDIIESVSSTERAKQLTDKIEKLLAKGGFIIKGWIISNNPTINEKTLMPDEPTTPTEKVLGITWNPVKDQFHFKVKLHFSLKGKRMHIGQDKKLAHIHVEIPMKLTKRMILSQINRVYDPLGLAAPFTVRAKILMRHLWTSETKLDWDDPIPENYRKDWIAFFQDLLDMEKIVFHRCIKPLGAIGNPVLIIFSDGSDNSYGACAYARWELPGGKYDSRLIISKNRLSPNKKISIDRIELCGAVLSKRLKTFLEKESRYQFAKCYHIVDSQIVYGMIQKESYGFNTFAATRVGEIHEGTNPEDWYWVESKHNIADWVTRGKKPQEINSNSTWQKGPNFLRFPESEWPISKIFSKQELTGRLKIAMATEAKKEESQETLAERIGINKYSSYMKLIRVTARVLAMYKRDPKVTLKNATKPLTPKDFAEAERFWILDCQKSMTSDIKKGRYKRLCPKVREDGVIVVGSRTERWVEMSYNKNEPVLLPYEHRFTRLYAEYIHRKGHYGVLTTASKIRSRFWITKIHRMVKSIKFNCVICKKLDKKLNMQVMGKLPEERLKPSPAWYNTAIDLFGPFKIRDEIKKRTIGKSYGVIFNCMTTRAVHLDLAPDYSTEKFLLVLRRFVALRGYPAKLYSDNGPQLVAANDEIQMVTKSWNWEELHEFGAHEGLKWEFTSADAPWQNGISEALVKSVKKSLAVAIGQNVMTFSELQTVCFEAANLVNERPIGRHPTSPEDGTYLCPNDLLLGRSTSRVPSGPFRVTTNPRYRYEFVQSIVSDFWKKWTRDFFPSLIIQQKWHTTHRNVNIGDIVLMQDSNQVRGNWRLGRVSKVYPGDDGKVRKVEVQYKNPKPGEHVNKYEGRGYITVQRAVNRLVVLLPAENIKTSDANDPAD